MNNQSVKTIIVVDEQFEKIEGHFYEYDKSVVEIFQQHGFDYVIYGHKNMIPALRQELNSKPWFNINTLAKVRKIPILGAILYRRAFWKQYEADIRRIIEEVKTIPGGYFLFFPNVYWYNILPIARVMKDVTAPAALLYRISVFDTTRLPQFILPVLISILKMANGILGKRKNVHYFSDSEVIADEWYSYLKSPMKVLPIPHLLQNKKAVSWQPEDKIRMYLPGGMRLEKGAQLLTEAFEQLAKRQQDILHRIILVTQFLGKDEVLEGYKARLAKLPLENQFLKHLTTEEYNEQLRQADVILIPYQVSEGYRARTSGILAEAIASSKPFITTDGTWMSIQARKYDTGLIIQDKDPQGLADAISSLVNNYSLYNKKAEEACSAWLSSQSKDVFFNQLVSSLD